MSTEDTKITEEFSTWGAFEKYLDKELNIFSDPDKQRDTEWIFRGMRNEDWHLESRLQRALEGYGRRSHSKMIESKLVKDFRRQFVNYEGRWTPGAIPAADLLALMQHYGAPTRLLDWTYSPYWALFMALDGSPIQGKRAVLWVMSTSSPRAKNIVEKEAITVLKTKLKGPWKKRSKILSDFQKGETSRLLESLIKQPVRCAFQVNSKWLNERLSVQQGVFLCLGDPKGNLRDNIGEIAYRRLRKIAIAPGIEHEVLRRLYRMGIHHGSAYPGLAGFAKSLTTKVLTYRCMPEDDCR